MIAPAGHHCNVRSGHLNATFGGEDMGSMAQTGLLLVPSDALGHTWALPGVLGGGQGVPPQTGPKNLNKKVMVGGTLLQPQSFLRHGRPLSSHYKHQITHFALGEG